MLSRGSGSIVAISSVVGVQGNAGQANYSSGKAGVVGLTKTLAKEWGQFKINVNAVAFGYLIEISEILAGVALIVGPFIWLCAWDRVSDRVRAAVLVSTVAAAVGATFLAINLHLANGASHPWFLPESGFDEGIDLDSVLPAIQFVIAAIGIIQLKRLRQNRTDRLGAGAHSVVNIA